MVKRRRNDGSEFEDLFDSLFEIATTLPWWFDLLLGVLSYLGFHYVSLHIAEPTTLDGSSVLMLMTKNFIAPIAQYLVPTIFLLGAFTSFLKSFRGKELMSSVASRNVTEALSKMNWKDFELLMGQYFKTQGYHVTQAGGARADGGVDVELHKDGDLYLVQCKHYRAWKVSVQVVRELYGVMTSRGAVGGFVVTSGYFTKDAKDFADGRVITLIDGEKLSQILSETHVAEKPVLPIITQDSTPVCPACHSPMVRRTASNGIHAGRDFWGCSRYPACKGIVSIS